MKITQLETDEAILAELGRRIARRRIDMELTQAQLAQQAGIAKRTLERIEGGASAQMSSMVRIFRVLDLLPGLDSMIAEAEPGPMDLLRRKGKVRQRASSSRRHDRGKTPWTWDADA